DAAPPVSTDTPSYDPAACPTTRDESEAIHAASEQDVRAASIGRWVNCHAERYYSGVGDLPGMWNGARGIEFADEADKWTVYYLNDDLSRDLSPRGHGRVEYVNCSQRYPAGCQLSLLALDGNANADVNALFWRDGFRDWFYDHYYFARVR